MGDSTFPGTRSTTSDVSKSHMNNKKSLLVADNCTCTTAVVELAVQCTQAESLELSGASIAGKPCDRAHYLKQELYGRIQTEPELFEWMQRAALDGIWYWDLENAENEWLSPEFKALFGYSDDEVPNTSSWWQENIFPQDKIKTIELFQKHVTEGIPYDSIVRYKHKNGSTVWVRCRGQASFNEYGVPVRMLGAHSDVTKLMEVQEELRKKEDVLDLLCTSALDGFWDWNIKTGSDYLSPRWKKALGYDEDDIENTVEAWKALLHPEDLSKAMEAVRKHMEEDAPYSVVLRYKRKDGSYAHMLAQGVAQKNEDGEWDRMFGTHTDVSYLEEARAARQASESKSVFLATMSHEIRTPLNAVLGMAQALQATELTEEQQDCVDTLTNSGKHLLSLINDILDFSQIEAGLVTITNQQFAIQETVREVVSALHVGAKAKGIDITFDTSIIPGARFISDPERTRQILFNLVGNAIKFTQKGIVNVSLREEEREGLSGVRIEVADTGCGMTKEQIPRIFDDFTQASSEVRRRYGGSGLGLSISKKLAAAMGGSIEVESEVGVGSVFTVWLPGFIPMPSTKPVMANDETVLLYEEMDVPLLVMAPANDQGSVGRAIEATGRNYVRIPNLFQTDEMTLHAANTVVVCLRDGSPNVQAIAFQLRKLRPGTILIDTGRRLPAEDVCGLSSKGIKFRCLPCFPTTDECEKVFQNRVSRPGQSRSITQGMALENIGRDLNILLAEDNPINVKVMKKLLSKYACKVEVACDGAVAIEKAKSGDWDLILMDMIMPEMDGVDATKEIRKFDPKAYIVALTANATTEDRDSCLESGMNDFLSKPISLAALGQVLSDVSKKAAENQMGLKEKL